MAISNRRKDCLGEPLCEGVADSDGARSMHGRRPGLCYPLENTSQACRRLIP